MNLPKRGLAAAGIVAGVIAAAGVSTMAFAGTPMASPTASATSTASDAPKQQGHSHTEVTGDELTKVSDAVKAKYSGITINQVQKDPDGSYDVDGTLNGTNVSYDVSSDLGTITERAARGGGGKGGRGGSQDTVVTGDEATKVTDAVKAKDSAIKVSEVRKDPDGSYDVIGTSGSEKVFYEVSKDLKTVTKKTMTGDHGGRGGAKPSTSPTATPSA